MNNIIRDSKILITGGAGFIGSNLVDVLVKDNEVVIVDDLSMGKLSNLPKSDHLHFFNKSITDVQFMKKLLTDWNFDYIYLLAAVASVADTISRPLLTHEINQNANINILEIIRQNKLKVKKILFSSSAAVYGNNEELPKKETSAIDPLSPYAIDKFATERFVINYGKLYDIPTVCTRFFNVYGPKQNPNSPYSGVLSLMLKGFTTTKKFKVYGDGKQTRDFVYVEDVVHALILLMLSDQSNHEVFNVATGTSISLNQVLNIFSKLFNENIQISYEESRTGDIRYSTADISKITKLGFKIENSVQVGLKRYLQDNMI